MDLVAPWHVGSSRSRAWTCVPCIGRRILNHCATREVPPLHFLNGTSCLCLSLCSISSRFLCMMYGKGCLFVPPKGIPFISTGWPIFQSGKDYLFFAFSSLDYLGTFDEYQLISYLWVYMWAFYSVLLIFMIDSEIFKCKAHWILTNWTHMCNQHPDQEAEPGLPWWRSG